MWPLLLVAGCGSAPHPWGASEFFGDEGAYLEYAAPGEPEGELLMVRIEEGWTLRRGASWAGGADLGSLAVDRGAGLWVDGELVLPGSTLEGTVAEGATVATSGEFTTWYGTFPETVVVERAEGRFAGTQVFARFVGPIFVTLDGESWDLVYYE